MKGAFLDRTLFLNLAGFYSKYKDQQVTIQTPTTTPGVIASFVDNAGRAEIWGVEAEMRLLPTPDLQLQASLGYTNADYKEFLTYIAGGNTPVDVSDQRFFQNTPEITMNASLTWSTDLAGGRLAITPAVSMRSSIYMFEFPSPLDQEGYALVDASVNWTSDDDRFTIGVHGRNLSDERYRVGGYYFPGAVFGNSVIGYYGAPRTVSVTAGVRF
jgi:iron complex outermembrane receptor protein